ncbi:heat-inducible transcriptional repressor HrcA [Crocosphaera sp. UHCC 0190]|uniref:heat-inducible transcriptional repressor HrcA n=1 Tax=Crocosphaera sp. UHCC 0190 TaxID=3110246 RepID=UPI002B210CC9|nr:heat-inducible transcriptional repressor HrcA [Crocosphaera sp. UHCC 0190]MEA5510354.1 heat-inducible transcriptional repressor HrcA [Crocosphaera sp. UHCC 0190]
MMVPTSLNKRYQNILRATVKHYIVTAEPVGSKTLLEEYNFSVSSATIRNTLGQLEKAGFLYQPYTSAGRIPSDCGYRIYVDNLMTLDEKIGQKIERQLSQKLKWETYNFETALQRATQILANLSGYIALITLPQTSPHQLRHLQLIQASEKQVMLIVVTDSYQTQSILIDLPTAFVKDNDDWLAEELQILSNFLNHQLKGKSLLEFTHLDWQKIDQEFLEYTDFLKTLLKQLQKYLKSSMSTPIMIHGVSEVLRQPEFSQLQQVQMLIHLLEEEKDQLLPLIFDVPETDILNKRVSVRIGAENPLESMRPCTLISANYCQGDTPVGSVGIIGPTRMLYEHTIPLVESTADYLSEALS